MDPSVVFDKSLIAPCGMNCGTCIAYLRPKNKCCGCWPETGNKVPHCSLCSIKNCEHLAKTDSKFCYECEIFPCRRLKQLDKRYSTKYRVSFIRNLLSVKETGISDYLLNESQRWTCPDCGSVVSVHRDNCLKCNRNLKHD
jgi:hypothetical protein